MSPAHLSSPVTRHPSPVTPSFPVLGVRVHAVQIPEVISQMEHWIAERSFGHTIVAANAHVVIEAQEDPRVKEAVNAADLVMPDGMPLVWLGRRRGFPLKERAYGPGLMEAFLSTSAAKGYRHFFYGSTPETLKALTQKVQERFGKVEIAGSHSPPFRPLTREEDEEIVEMLNAAQPDVLWVGLGCPKQELWMYAHKERLRIPVLAGVGAAFDFLAGVKPRAPRWMQQSGLEWLFRLLSEPRRLWRRYLVKGGKFVALVVREEVKGQ